MSDYNDDNMTIQDQGASLNEDGSAFSDQGTQGLTNDDDNSTGYGSRNTDTDLMGGSDIGGIGDNSRTGYMNDFDDEDIFDYSDDEDI